MLFETLYAFNKFLLLMLAGIGAGAIFGLLTLAKLFFKNNVIFNNIVHFLYAILFAAGFFIMITLVHYGQFRLFLLLGYILGFYAERKTLGRLFANLYKFVYNKIIQTIKKCKSMKLFKFLFS